MKQKTNYRMHTIETRRLQHVVDDLKAMQKRLRRKYLDIDVKVCSFEHKINDILERLRR